MPLNDTALNLAADALADAITHVSLHTAQPDTAGSNESTAARQPITWSAAAQGDISAANIQFTGGEPSGPATHLGYWSALTDGTFYGYQALTGDQAFNAAGEYTVTSVAENSSAS